MTFFLWRETIEWYGVEESKIDAWVNAVYETRAENWRAGVLRQIEGITGSVIRANRRTAR